MFKKALPAHKKAKQSYFAYYRKTTWVQDILFGIILTFIGGIVYLNSRAFTGGLLLFAGPIIIISSLVRYKMGWKAKGKYWEDKRNRKA